MLRARARLPLLAKIAGPAEGKRAWSLRRADFRALGAVLPRLAEQRVVAVAGEGEEPAVAAIALASAAAAYGPPHDPRRLRPRPARGWRPARRPRCRAPACTSTCAGRPSRPTCCSRWRSPGRRARRHGAGSSSASAPAEPATEAEALLGLQSFSHVIAKLRGGYDFVLLLAPPVARGPAPVGRSLPRRTPSVAGLTGDPGGAAAVGRKRLRTADRRDCPLAGARSIAVVVG